MDYAEIQQQVNKRIYRIAVASDMHIGDGLEFDDFHKRIDFCFGELFTLYSKEIDGVFLVGDIFDIWRWGEDGVRQDVKNCEFIRRLGALRPIYIQGNHDLHLSEHFYSWLQSLGYYCVGYYYEWFNLVFLHGHQVDDYNSKYYQIGKFFTKLSITLKSFSVTLEKILHRWLDSFRNMMRNKEKNDSKRKCFLGI